MPNWVDTSITISGSEEEIAKFRTKASKPHPIEYNGEIGLSEEEFSFWNFISPPQEAILSGEYFGTNGWIEGEKKGDTTNNWYNWNNDNWNTKWDACDQRLDTDDPTQLTYYFQTAWSPASPVFEAMVAQHPELAFSIWWEEEQGFGEELSGTAGELVITKEWDIPASHADYVEQDKEDNCPCSYDDNEDDWFDDCPRENDPNQPEPDMVY